MLGMAIDYAGDNGSLIVKWLEIRLQAISLALSSGLPEPALTLLYSGIDTLGWLAAPTGVTDATRTTFKDWCNRYLVSKLKSLDRQPLTSTDLYAARCSVLHTSSSVSSLSRDGNAHEIYYQFGENVGANFFGATKLDTLVIDVFAFALSFREASLAFLEELGKDSELNSRAHGRANTFFRWGRLIGTNMLVEIVPPTPSSTQLP